MIRPLSTPLTEATVRSLRAGDRVLLSGGVFTARDAAHKRLAACITRGEALPVDLRDQVVYYCGPTPAPQGRVIGSAGPTTAGRMDAYAPLLMESAGVRGMVGKGSRGPLVVDAMRKCGAVYLAATGGAGALLSRRIVSCDILCYEDLGPEALRRLVVVDFPLVVAIDSFGHSLYAEGPIAWHRASPR